MSAPAALPPLRRDPERGVVAGICAGLGNRLGIDPVLIRIAFAALAIATAGVAAAAYLLVWPLLPVEPSRAGAASGGSPAGASAGSRSEGAAGGPADGTDAEPRATGRAGIRHGGWRVAAGAGLLTLAVLLVLRELGIWWSDAVIWPAILAASGGALLWRQSTSAATAAGAEPASLAGQGTEPAADRRRAAIAGLYRGGFGIALVLGAALLFLSANDALGETRDFVLAALAVLIALALILAPFLWRVGHSLARERAERIRSQERAELAAHLHDSVLQTLTLMQKRAADPREVASLARRQERELRAWLFGDGAAAAPSGLAAALEAAGAEIEEAHRVPVEVVAVGDRPLGPRGEALLAAAREAITNAAKFAPDAGAVRVYAELGPDRAEVFIRDRGPGFALDSVPADRRGVRDSIIARMERHGGNAEIRSRPGAGTEVELAIGGEAE